MLLRSGRVGTIHIPAAEARNLSRRAVQVARSRPVERASRLHGVSSGPTPGSGYWDLQVV